MLKLGRSFGFVALFIFMYNNQIDKNIKRDKLLIPFIILAALQNIIGGGRGYILWLVCFGFTTAYIVNMKKYSWKKSLAFKYIKIGAVALIVVFIAFYLLKYLVRVGNTVNSILDYIGYYAGGSIQNFNLYICSTLQLAESDTLPVNLDVNDLAVSRTVKEVLDTLCLIKQINRDTLKNYEYSLKEVDTKFYDLKKYDDPDVRYYACVVDKNRAGAKPTLVFRLNLAYNVWNELGYLRLKQ